MAEILCVENSKNDNNIKETQLFKKKIIWNDNDCSDYELLLLDKIEWGIFIP